MPRILVLIMVGGLAAVAPAHSLPPLDAPDFPVFGDKIPKRNQPAPPQETTFEKTTTIEREKSKLVLCSEMASAEEDPDAAVLACDAAVAEDPTSGDAYYYRAFAQLSRDAYAEAEQDYTKAIELGAARLAESYYQRGACKEQQRRLREAAADFKKAAELKPEWSAARRKVEEYHWAYE